MQHRYEFKGKDGSIRGVNLPFTLEVESGWEQVRALTFWTKEPETLYWISDFKDNDNIVFWDIGANIGIYSLFCAYVHSFSKTYAFEPHSTNFMKLMANVYNNDFGRLIHPQFYAMTNEAGYAEFFVKTMEAGSSGGQIDQMKDTKKYEVPMMSGDHFAEMTGINPTHIKIDVDGNELKILQGMANILPAVKSLLVEANDSEVIKYLKAFGFEPDKKYMALRGAGWKRASNTNVIFKRKK